MAGTQNGGFNARDTNLRRYGPDFYKEIGRIGGRNGHTGGFAKNHELARIAGAKGGHISRRGKASPKPCLFEECDEVARTRGMCNKHYGRIRREERGAE